jgi:ABC-type transporter Mla subunit MlaD
MADNNDLLQKIRTVVREEVKAETEPINKRLDAQVSSIAQINTTLGQVKTLVEATAAGQKEIRETMATKADVLTVGGSTSFRVKVGETE